MKIISKNKPARQQSKHPPKLFCKTLKGPELIRATQQEIQFYEKQRRGKHQRIYSKSYMPYFQQPRISSRSYQEVSCYGAFTNKGLVRAANQDRVSIILSTLTTGEPIYFFGLFDGHGGSDCCDFLRDNLHKRLINSKQLLQNTLDCIINCVRQTDSELLQLFKKGEIDNSGSCCLLLIILNKVCYVVNVGDSRAVLVSKNFTSVADLTRDHKPNDQSEQARILLAGGQICQMSYFAQQQLLQKGPLRVTPGNLTVSRTIGDPQAKLQNYKGNRKVVIPDPEITMFKLDDSHDFIVLASDGIFDKLNSSDILEIGRRTMLRGSVHEYAGDMGIEVVAQAMNRRSEDNLTCIFVGLNGFSRFNKSMKHIRG